MRNFKIAVAPNRHAKMWDEKDLTISQLGDLMVGGHDPRDNKDGLCFVAATLLDGKRNLKSVAEVHILVYDIDGAQSLDEVRKILSDTDVFAYVYTTYSHKSTRTEILTEHYEKWAKQAKEGAAPNLERLQKYLTAKGKGHLTNIVFDDMQGWERIADKGNCYVLEHDPVDKIRVVLPLDKPIVIAKLGSTNAKCNEAYKAIYHGVGQKFGFEFDPACSDPTRLFYFPSCPKDKISLAWFAEYGEPEGPFLKWESIERATITTKKAMETGGTGSVDDKPTRAKEYGVTDKNGMWFDLWHWYENHKFAFDIEGLIERALDDQILAPRANGGHTITCPFEDEHSDVGGMGTFASNEDGGERGWTIYCSHASCQSENRKKLDFLKEWVSQGLVCVKDILSEKEVEELEYEQRQRERTAAAEDIGFEISVLPKVASDITPEVEEPYIPVQLEMRQDPAKFNTEIMDRLSHASSGNMLARINDDIQKYNSEQGGNFLVTDQMLTELLATETAKIGIADIRKYAICDDPARVSNQVEQDRIKTFPLEEAVQQILTGSYAGLNLDREFKRVGHWYGLNPSEVRREFEARRSVQWKTVLDSKLRERFPKITKQYAKLVHGSKLELLDEERTRETGKLKTLTMEAFHNLMANEVVEITEKDNKGNLVSKSVPVSKHWAKMDTSIRVFTDVTFDPGQPSPRTHANEYNLWNGFPVKPLKLTDAQRAEVVDRAVRHIKEVWCGGNDEWTEWVLLYFADIFQRPWNKPQSAICIMGGQGTGKSIVLDCGLQPMLKTMYTATSEREQLVGKFNKHAEGKLLWLAEESLFSGDRNSMNKLKDLISRDKISIEPKTKDVYEVPNRVRYIFTSNQLHPLKLEHDDRRFFVLAASDIHKQDTEYNSALKEWFDNGGARMFMSYLMDWKFCDANKHHFPKWKGDAHGPKCSGWQHLFLPPNTRHKESQKGQSRGAEEEFFVELLQFGRLTSLPDHVLMEQPRTMWWPYHIDTQTSTVGNNSTWTKVHPGTTDAYLWLKLSKTDVRNVFNAYVRHHDTSQARFTRNQFGDLWDRYFGRPEDFEHAPRPSTNPQDTAQKGIRIPPRRIAIRRALDRQLITKEDAQQAEENYNSHIANEMAEKDHQ